LPDAEVLAPLGERCVVSATVKEIVHLAVRDSQPGDQLLVMSNGGFGGIHQKLLEALREKAGKC